MDRRRQHRFERSRRPAGTESATVVAQPGSADEYHVVGGKRKLVLALTAVLVIQSAAAQRVHAQACDGAVEHRPLFATILAGKTATVEELLDRGADSDAECRVPIERVFGADLEADVLGWLGLRPLAAAVISAQPQATIAALLRAGADAGEAGDEGLDAVALAALLGRVESLDALIEAGAADDVSVDIDISRPTWAEILLVLGIGAALEPSQGVEIDLTPLQLAAMSGTANAPQIVSRLVRAGADAEAETDGGRTALLLAAHAGDARVVAALLEAGADVDHADDSGSTPLIVAVFERRRTVAMALLAGGADAGAENDDGETALSAAIENRDAELADALRTAGAATGSYLPAAARARPSAAIGITGGD